MRWRHACPFRLSGIEFTGVTDGQRWLMTCAAINLDGVDVQIREQVQSQVAR